MKIKNWLIFGSSLVVLVAVAMGLHTYNGYKIAHAPEQITIGSMGSDYEVWQYIAKSKAADKLNLKLTVKQINDGVQLNNATAEHNVNVNAFQSDAYLKSYNHENPKNKLQNLGTTYLEPMGIYSDKYKSIKDIPTGATIAIADNPANTSRGLLLLQSAGLITLKKGFDSLGNTDDIVANPRHLKFKKIDDTTGSRILNSVGAALISNTVALEGNLNVLKDSLYHEKVDRSTRQNVNVLAAAGDISDKDKKTYKKLVKLYHDEAIQKHIKDKYEGTKVPVDKPLSYLK